MPNLVIYPRSVRCVPYFAPLFIHLLTIHLGAVSATGAQAVTYPGRHWAEATPASVGLDITQLEKARTYALSGGGSGFITRHGKLVMSWGDPGKKYDLKSTSKSIGITALGLALADEKMRLHAPARQYHPELGVPPTENERTGWLDEILVLHLATQTAGFAKPGGYEPLLFKPGTKWHYSDGGPNWLAECVTRVYRQDIESLLFDKVFTPIGITRRDLHWRKHAYRPGRIDGVLRHEFGSGVHANVNAMARIGLLYLRRGRWKHRQLLSPRFVNLARKPRPDVQGLPEHILAGSAQDKPRVTYGNAAEHYGLLWWNNADGTLENVPRDAFWSWGLYESLIVVIPSLDMVITRAGKSWPRNKDARHYDVLKPFFEPIVASVIKPVPSSPVVSHIEWSPIESIVRLAKGSDNWPITWADDGYLYTAYGDGWGFEPRVEKKLSLGLARVNGGPTKIQGFNIRSSTAEQVGDGASGLKASGLLCVDGMLYLWARNAHNSQLAWSKDYGKSWTWADWKFTTSFGCPTFLNYGKNYAEAADEFVYVISQDTDNAYTPADRFVLARVRRDHIREQNAYEFFESSEGTHAHWTSDMKKRGAVFRHQGKCYRSGLTYNAGMDRYLWCQIHPESRDARGPRFDGGFGIYDAPTPWGPWSTVFITDQWDVGPGETGRFPTKWMSEDGETIHLLFSGDDCFSVRRATLVLRTSG